MLLAVPVNDPATSTALIPAAAQPPTPLSPSSTRTIGDVYDRFIADPKHQWSKRTQIAHATTRKWVVEVFGEETPLTEVTREGCRDFVALLREMPKSAHQRFPAMTITEVIAAANSPTLKEELMNAIIEAFEAHSSLSKQALDSQKVRDGLKEVLLGPAQLYGALRARAGQEPLGA